MKATIFRNLFILIVLSAFSGSGFPQDRGGVFKIGVIDEIMQDDGYIVISGTRIDYRDADVVITYNGEKIDSVFLAVGQRVSYRTRYDGSISEINLVGRYRELDEIDTN